MKRRRVFEGERDERKKPRVAGKYGWLAIHLFMGHLSGVAMATPVISGAIVKLSNEKIRKYHLARAPTARPTRRNPHNPPLRRPLSFSPLLLSRGSLSTLFILLILPLPRRRSEQPWCLRAVTGGYRRWYRW